MEKKSKVWIIVLAVLLAVTLALGVFCKLELDAANEKYRASRDETRALAGQVDQLTEELDQAKATQEAADPATQEPTQKPTQGPSVQPTEDTAAALTEEMETLRQENQRLQAELDGKADVETQLADAQKELADTKAELAQAQADLESARTGHTDTAADLETEKSARAQAESDLEQARTELADTKAELAQVQADLESARTGHTDTAADLEAEKSARAQAESDLEQARTELADTKAELDAVRAELTQTQTKLADTQKALEAYRLAFAGEEEGSRHSATALDETVQVASDGVTATYLLENTAASGNSLSFRLEVAGEEVFASEKLAPGQSVTTFQLEKPLTAGEYEGALTVITYGKDGVASSKMTTPVTVIVE